MVLPRLRAGRPSEVHLAQRPAEWVLRVLLAMTPEQLNEHKGLVTAWTIEAAARLRAAQQFVGGSTYAELVEEIGSGQPVMVDLGEFPAEPNGKED